VHVAYNESVSLNGVTYNGVAMTEVSGTSRSAGGYFRVKTWFLAAPDTGTHNVVATLSSSAASAGSAISLTEANQTIPATADNSVTAASDNTNTSVSVTTTGGAIVIEAAVLRNGSGTITSITKIEGTQIQAGVTDGTFAFESHYILVSGSPQTMSNTVVETNYTVWASLGFTVAHSAPASAFIPQIIMM
jgi:hypothetical protein